MLTNIKNLLLKPNKVLQSIYIIVFRVLLDYMYCNIVSPLYSYIGMTAEQSTFYYMVSWIMVICYILMMFTIIDVEKNGAVVLSIILICSAVPTTTIVAFLGHNLEFAVLNVLYWFFTVAFYKHKGQKIVLGKNTIKRSSLLIYAVFLFFAAVLLLICVEYTGIHVSFNLYDVYGTRAAFKSDKLPTILQYLFSACIIVFPVIIVYGLNKKKRILALAATICQLLAFFADGRKSTIFVLIATILGYYFIHNLTARMIPAIMMGVTVIGFIEKICIGTENFINLVARRLFLVTAYLQYAYFDFFSNNVKDYFRQSIVGRLGFSSPYTKDIPTLVGGQYYVNNSYANNGLFADAYSNFGALGVVVLPILIVCALKLLDRVCEGLTSGICMGIIIVSAYTLLSSSFFTVMLTHGFLLGCIIIYLVPRFSYQRDVVVENEGMKRKYDDKKSITKYS